MKKISPINTYILTFWRHDDLRFLRKKTEIVLAINIIEAIREMREKHEGFKLIHWSKVDTLDSIQLGIF